MNFVISYSIFKSSSNKRHALLLLCEMRPDVADHSSSSREGLPIHRSYGGSILIKVSLMAAVDYENVAVLFRHLQRNRVALYL